MKKTVCAMNDTRGKPCRALATDTFVPAWAREAAVSKLHLSRLTLPVCAKHKARMTKAEAAMAVQS
jgi:hypothetical protein